ncbi:MAG: arylsulfatase [Planctomycetota bacterium]|nr:arylsulfatase [Planctomycetota bacterium]
MPSSKRAPRPTPAVLLLGLLPAACAGPIAGSGAPEAVAPRTPNVIYILADDLGYGDLGCYGQELIATPHLDALAAGGLRFTDHYSGSTVCAPSRCVLMTGKHTGVCAIRGNNRGPDGYELPIPVEEVFLSEVLSGAGYRTACIGKWGLGGPGSTSHPHAVGFERFFGFLNHGHAHNHFPDVLWRDDVLEETGNVVVRGGSSEALGSGVASKRVAWANDLFFDEAASFIAAGAEDDRPFFLYLALSVPHANNEAGQLLEHMPEEHRPQRGQEVPDLGTYGARDWTGPNKGQAAMITRMDERIGELVSQLSAMELAEDTLILFSSDNGPHREGGNDPRFFDANGPYRGIKRDLYDGGIRVPMIASWPGTVRPGTTQHMSSFADVLPTVCDLLGDPPPEGVTGRSFAPTLLGSAPQPEHDHLYWEFFEQKGKQAVRRGPWKAVRLRVHEDRSAPVQLFDLRSDPGEQRDVAAERPELAAELARLMDGAHVRSPERRFQFRWER